MTEILEETPQATALPATGATDPILFSGLGAALLGLGLFIRKKKEDEQKKNLENMIMEFRDSA